MICRMATSVCLDRLYLNGYVPNLQVSGQVVNFLTQHLGFGIASPAIFQQSGDRFRAAVQRFARVNAIPVVRFAKGDRTVEVMRRPAHPNRARPLPAPDTARSTSSSSRATSPSSERGLSSCPGTRSPSGTALGDR